jgi:hypothetical protein
VICADAQLAETGSALSAAGLAFGVLGDTGDEGDVGEGEGGGARGAGASAESARLTLVPVTLAKGLEFDHVILVEPGRIATGEAYGLRRLYVALTRAVSRLTVFHAEPLPAELSLHTIGENLYPSRGVREHQAFGVKAGRKGFIGPGKLAHLGIVVMPIVRVPRQGHPETVRACLVPANLRSVATVMCCGSQRKPRGGNCLPRQAGRRAVQPGP